MPSHPHESFADLLGDAPEDLSDILRAAGQHDGPGFTKLVRVDRDLGQSLPIEYAADGVYRLSDGGDDTILAVILEVQRKPDPDKEWSWPVYLAVTRARERCETMVVVLATNEATANWARSGIALDRNHTWRPVVIGPSTLPEVATAEAARARPVLAIVWALTHAQKASDAPGVKAVLEGVAESGLARTLVTYYTDVILEAASDQVRRLVEALMLRVPENYQIKNPVLRRLVTDAKAEGREEALDAARDAALDRVRSVLYARATARSIVLSAEHRDLVSTCRDEATLTDWAIRLALGESPKDVFVAVDPPHH